MIVLGSSLSSVAKGTLIFRVHYFIVGQMEQSTCYSSTYSQGMKENNIEEQPSNLG